MLNNGVTLALEVTQGHWNW